MLLFFIQDNNWILKCDYYIKIFKENCFRDYLIYNLISRSRSFILNIQLMLHYLVCVDIFNSHMTRSLEAKVIVLLYHFIPATFFVCLFGEHLKQLYFLNDTVIVTLFFLNLMN